jgi:hypothetical protein
MNDDKASLIKMLKNWSTSRKEGGQSESEG